jgi:hypothetical protein
LEAGTATKDSQYYYGVGRRKSSVARVRLFPGQGNITVNNRTAKEYFGDRDIYQTVISEPLRLTNTFDLFNIQVCQIRGLSDATVSVTLNGDHDSGNLPDIWTIVQRWSPTDWSGTKDDPGMSLHPQSFFEQCLGKLRASLPETLAFSIKPFDGYFIDSY